jgi:competence ComEA-like helix-hairpin-helix protein
MQIHKPNYFNAYKFSYKLLPLLICYFLFACSGQNAAKQDLSTENQSQNASPVININTASVETLEKLPNIGAKTAREIVEYREKFGKFRKPEHLLLIRGISDKKFREIQNLITVE